MPAYSLVPKPVAYPGIAVACVGTCLFLDASSHDKPIAEAPRRSATPSEPLYIPERLIVPNATIQGQPVRLAFDTAAGGAALFKPAVERLGLQIFQPRARSRAAFENGAVGRTEVCESMLIDHPARGFFYVLDRPAFLPPDVDGLLGWPSLKNRVFALDAQTQSITFLDRVPAEAAGWMKLRIHAASTGLAMQVRYPSKKAEIILIDTADPGGVSLSPDRWRRWRAQHADRPATIYAGYMIGSGYEVKEECWADRLQFGALTLSDVSVRAANKIQQKATGSSSFAASLGLAALKPFNVVVDGPGRSIYLRSRPTSVAGYRHNRAGLAFRPDERAAAWIAAVAPAGPAYEAGIRDGDVLMKLADLDQATSSDSRSTRVYRHFAQPAGTKLELTLSRAGQLYATSIVLRDLIGPGAATDPERNN